MGVRGVGWGRGEEGVATGLKDPSNLLSFFNAQSTMTVISGRIRHVQSLPRHKAQQLYESRGGRLGSPSLIVRVTSVDVKQH